MYDRIFLKTAKNQDYPTTQIPAYVNKLRISVLKSLLNAEYCQDDLDNLRPPWSSPSIDTRVISSSY